MSIAKLKIAFATDDGETISRHFGRAQYFTILTIENGKVSGREQVAKEVHSHGHGHHHDQPGNVQLHEPGEHQPGHDHDHASMFAPLQGCVAVVARGMGRGAYNGLRGIGAQPIITDIARIDDALAAYLDGSIIDHPEKLH